MASLEPQAVISWGTGPAVAMSFTVNFGMFAGREVADGELERLGEVLVELVSDVSVTAENRYEFAKGSAANLHQVRIDIDHEALPPAEGDIEQLRGRIGEALAVWLRYSVTGVSGKELTDAELNARDAVLEMREPELPS